jgi:hypothetical protein
MDQEFKPGDVVSLRREYRKAKESDVSCIRMLDAGLPNEFTVVRQVETTGGLPAIALSPCCDRLRGDDGELLCSAHPPQLFDLVRRGSPDLSAFDRIVDSLLGSDPKQFIGVEVPILGSLLHFAHYDDGDKEGILLKILGARPIMIAGKDLETLYGLFSKLRTFAKAGKGSAK